MSEVDTVEVKFNDSDEWITLSVLGKRRGYLRLGWADGKSKWVDLKTVTMKQSDNLKIASGTSETNNTDDVAVAGEEEEVEAAVEVGVGAGAGATDAEAGAQFTELTRGLNYFDQAAFFLNAFWVEYEGEKDAIFEIAKMMAGQDKKSGDNGKCLDEVNARKILQDLDMAMSRQKYLDEMRKIDVNNDRKMSMLEFLLYKYSISVGELIARPQTGMTKELKDAMANLAAAQTKQKQLEEEKAALEEVAAGGGVKAMQARTQLPNFKKRDFNDVVHEIKMAEKRLNKAKQSPELRAKGTEFIAEFRGVAAAPKKAVGASGIGDEDHAEVNFEEQIWKEDLLFWIRQASYRQQAGFFLNAYWEDVGETAEVVWDFTISMEQHDTRNAEAGTCLDEGSVSNFMRANVDDFDMTATQLRKKLAKEICLNNDKKMSLIEFLLNNFGLGVEDLMTRPQGEPSDTVRKMRIGIKEIERNIAEWQAKVTANDELAAGSGAKAMGARNLQSQGYGKKELRNLNDDMEKCIKKLGKAENSDNIEEPGFIWIMNRTEQYNAEPGRR